MKKDQDFERVEVVSAGDLRTWLEENHSQQESVWLVTYKKHTGPRYLSRDDVLDELLCYGWIDGIRRKLDENRTMQLVSPRRAQHWARTYKERVARLEAEGRMRPPGARSIEESKRNGMWDFMDDVDDLIKPDDLVRALNAYPSATQNFEAFPDSSKRFVLRWIKLAKKPETRDRRVKRIADLASRNQRLPGS